MSSRQTGFFLCDFRFGGCWVEYMKNFKMGLVVAILTIGAAMLIVIQYEAQIKLRAENESLTQQLAQLKTDNEGLSNLAAQAKSPLPLSDDRLNELLKLRSEVGMLRRRTNELWKLHAPSAGATPGHQQPAVDSQVEPEQASAEFKMNSAKQSVLGMIMYANDNGKQFPTNFDQTTPYLGGDSSSVRSNLSQLEIVYQGSWTNIANPSSTIVVREKQAWQTSIGKWMKTYGFADGHSEIHTEPDGNFDAWEQQHMVSPSPNQ